MKPIAFLLLFVLSLYSCNQTKKDNQEQMEIWKNEVTQTELDFSKMAQKEGMNKAFLTYVADNAVLLRNDSLIKGRSAIADFMKNSTSKGLKWSPDFVDVASSGDLAYTYGKYTYTYQDSTGAEKMSSGIFHTVWKRQKDGSWKFVWD
ncbi:YybH family protein [Aestuariivivens insulae]|uniref:YybH family protein n=1 Tax=Aestuariivivens insulae TaxID=1621988 RepID=UPI001F57D4F9|nr:DUF4440 domain-containing protein [Aestuariivivens insulae]